MRLVDHQKRAPLDRAVLEQLFGEAQTQNLFRFAFMGQSEIVEDRLQEGRAVGEMAVGEESAGDLGFEPIEQRVAEQRLAGAGIAAQKDEAFIFRERTLERGKGRFVNRGRIVKIGIRRRREWPTLEPEAVFIHESSSPKSPHLWP